jgi:hypothetical protein
MKATTYSEEKIIGVWQVRPPVPAFHGTTWMQ